jgi:hypothetical protein
MYGGGHYIQSADATAQGKAIAKAAHKFGDGKTLPFPPCKRYYNPYLEENGVKKEMYACRLHHELRKKRVMREKGVWRGGEKRLDEFWSRDGNCVIDECQNEAMKPEKKKARTETTTEMQQ